MKKLLLILLLIATTPVFAQYKITEYTRDTNMTDDDIVSGANSPDGATPTNAAYTLGALKTYINAGVSTVTNWSDLQGLKAAVNWADESRYLSTNALNWQGLQQVQTADINWSSLVNSEIQRGGLNWLDANILVDGSNVGIGTLANNRLRVSTSARTIATFLSTASSINTTDTAVINIGNNDGAAASADDKIGVIAFIAPYDSSNNFASSTRIVARPVVDFTSSNQFSRMDFETTRSGFNFPLPAMTISGANVGVGTYIPVAKFSVIGNVGIGSSVTSGFVQTIPPTGGMIIEGNVGIGSLSPGAKLSVMGNGTTTGLTISARDSSGTPTFRVLDGGNVGIGTTVIPKKLVIAGDAYFNTATTAIILKSPDGTCSSCGVDNSDVFTCSSVSCP